MNCIIKFNRHTTENKEKKAEAARQARDKLPRLC